jgi:predicted nucleotidyltransferase
METMTSTINEIVSHLRAIDPFRIVLFGSHAFETEELESDIDLLVILDSEDISQTYEQRMQSRLLVRESVQAINKQVAIDLIVYTKGEYQYLQRQGSSFLKEIESTGKTLYEKAGCRAAEFVL